MVTDNMALHQEVEQLELELQRRLQTHKQQLESTEVTLNALLKQKSTDESAIAGLVATVQELRQEREEGSSRVASLDRELEESGKELVAVVARSEALVSELLLYNYRSRIGLPRGDSTELPHSLIPRLFLIIAWAREGLVSTVFEYTKFLLK